MSMTKDAWVRDALAELGFEGEPSGLPEHVELPGTMAGEGFAPVAAGLLMLTGAFASAPETVPIGALSSELRDHVAAWSEDPRVVVVRGHQAERGRTVGRVQSTVLAGEPVLLVDGREAAATVVIVLAEVPFILRVRQGYVDAARVDALRAKSQPRFAADPLGHLPEPVAAPAAELDAWLGDVPASPWVRDAASELAARRTPLGVVAAAALVGDYAGPSLPADPSRIEALIAGAETPADRVDRWAATLPDAVRQAAWGAALQRAEELTDLVAALPNSLPDDEQEQADFVTWLRLERDTLECVAELLAHAEPGDAAPQDGAPSTDELPVGALARAALDALDHEAAPHMTIWAFGDDDHPRLSLGAVLRPEAWWVSAGEPELPLW